MDEIVRLQTEDGSWEVGGVDRRRGIWPEDMNCVWDEWGPKTARFTLKREPGAIYPDLTGFTPCEIERGSGIWEGYIDQTPVADVNSLAVEAIGWQDYADDDVLRKLFVHSPLSDWRDYRSFPEVDPVNHPAGLMAEVGPGTIRLGWPNQSWIEPATGAAVVFDAGEGSQIKRVSVAVTHNGAFAYMNAKLYVIGHETPDWDNFMAGRVDFVSNIAAPNGTYSGTLPGNQSKRYVTILAYYGGTTAAAAGLDAFMTINVANLFAEQAYSGYPGSSASILKASTVLKDLLPRMCPQWNRDLTGISDTLLTLPDFAPTQERTFREYVDVLNSLHGYVTKLERSKRFVFRPQALRPALTAAPGLGIEFRDASKNATRDLYNKAIGVGTGPDGEPLRVQRVAAEQPNTPGELIDVLPNPSFDVNTTGWSLITTYGTGTMVRDTAVFDSAPASLKITPASGTLQVSTTLAGTFKQGVSYRLRFWDGTTKSWYMLIGHMASEDWSVLYMPGKLTPENNYKTVVWIPQADRTGVVVLFTVGQLSRIDTLSVEIVRPTLLDRRGRWRAKQVSMPSQAVDKAVLTQFADVWLQSHMFTPLRGDVTVSGSGFREYSTGRPVDPFELGEYTTELVHLAGQIDPDKGYLGRTAKVANVSYDGNNESASVSLDASREDFEKTVARYDVISSGAGPGG